MTLIPFGESDYNELLLQAVAVLDQARSSLAIKISDTISNAHWNLGKLLTEKKLESKHGSAVKYTFPYCLNMFFVSAKIKNILPIWQYLQIIARICIFAEKKQLWILEWK